LPLRENCNKGKYLAGEQFTVSEKVTSGQTSSSGGNLPERGRVFQRGELQGTPFALECGVSQFSLTKCLEGEFLRRNHLKDQLKGVLSSVSTFLRVIQPCLRGSFSNSFFLLSSLKREVRHSKSRPEWVDSQVEGRTTSGGGFVNERERPAPFPPGKKASRKNVPEVRQSVIEERIRWGKAWARPRHMIGAEKCDEGGRP